MLLPPLPIAHLLDGKYLFLVLWPSPSGKSALIRVSTKDQAQAEPASPGSLVPLPFLDCEWGPFGTCDHFLQAIFLESQKIFFPCLPSVPPQHCHNITYCIIWKSSDLIWTPSHCWVLQQEFLFFIFVSPSSTAISDPHRYTQ